MSGFSGDESQPGGLHSGLRRMDEEAKLMRSRVSARECRARKKKRYQKLESMAESKEKIVLQLREELEKLGRLWTAWRTMSDSSLVAAQRLTEVIEINHQWNEQYCRLERDSNRIIQQLDMKLKDSERELQAVKQQLAQANRLTDENRVPQAQHEAVIGKLEYLQANYQTALETIDQLRSDNKRLSEETRYDERRRTERGRDSEQARLLQHQLGVMRQDLAQEQRAKERLETERGRLLDEKHQLQDENFALRQQLEQYNAHYRRGGHS